MTLRVPILGAPMLPLVTLSSEHGMMMRNVQYDGTIAGRNFPGANRAVFVPVKVTDVYTVVKLFQINAGSVAGNYDLGIYDVSGNRIVSSGSFAQSGANVIQEQSVAAVLAPGPYYLAVAASSTSGGIWAAAVDLNLMKMVGVMQMASAFPLPSTATFATPTTDFMPQIGMSNRSLVA